MTRAMYRIGRTLESASVRLGIGRFEVPETYRCDECRAYPSSPDCYECRNVWIHEISQLNYSDVFERQLNTTVGLFCLLLAATNWLLNNALHLWETGSFLGGLNAVFSPYFPDVDTWPVLLRTTYVLLLGAGALLCMITVWALFGIAFFLMAMNPMGQRHWRHMTPSAIFVLIFFSIFQFAVIIQGLDLMDLVTVVFPAITGMLALSLVLCMRKSTGQPTDEGVVKLV